MTQQKKSLSMKMITKNKLKKIQDTGTGIKETYCKVKYSHHLKQAGELVWPLHRSQEWALQQLEGRFLKF